MFITKLMLEQHGACHDMVAVFDKEWPNGATVTENNLIKATELGLPIKWMIKVMYPHHWDAYDKAIAPHWDAYKKAIAPHWDAYKKALARAILSLI